MKIGCASVPPNDQTRDETLKQIGQIAALQSEHTGEADGGEVRGARYADVGVSHIVLEARMRDLGEHLTLLHRFAEDIRPLTET